MARVILGNNETYTVFNNSQASDVFGSNGAADIVVIGGNTKATVNVQSSVERVELTGKVGDYTFQGSGNQISVLSNGVVQATVFANADTGGTRVAFADGSALLTISSAGLKLGSATVASTAGAISSTAAGLNASDVSTAPGLGGSVTPPTTAQTFTLTTGADNLVGTAGDNTFLARTINGANTFQDGDAVDGGAGSDVVYLDFASSATNATTPNLKNIESVVVRAQLASTDANGTGSGNDGNNMPQTRTVQIDAQRSLATNEANRVTADIGVTNWESSNSRSDVVIEDVRIGNTQKTKDVTITFRESDPGNVDFGLYFDQHSLRNTGSGSTAINILLMDTAAANSTTAAIAATPLLDVNFNSYTFFQDNVKVFLGGAGTAAGAAINDALTYPAMKTAFELALKTANVGGVVKDLSTSVTVSLSAPVNMTTEANKSVVSSPVAASFLNLTGQVITLTSAGTSTITSRSSSGESGGWESLGLAPSTGAIVQTFNTGNTSTTELVTSKIVLDDVGRGSTGGDLVVGGLSIGDTSTSRGVERFEITVEDSSKLQTINGTNNALREVTIVNGTTSNFTTAYNTVVTNAGNLTVNGKVGDDAALPGVQPGAAAPGNPASVGDHDSTYGFTDVRLIDASAMTGQLAFRAQVTTDSLKKYVNLVDTQNLPTADVAASGNVNFNVLGANFAYTGGANNDTMVVLIDSAVAASTTLTGQSDFTIVIDGGAGSDRITTNIGGNETAAWLVDQARNANITVNGGAGNDTITTTGAGNVVINAGADNDTVYTDNSGNIAAQWTVNNAAGAILADLQSNAAASGFLYKGELTVIFAPAYGLTSGAAATTNGFGVKVAIPTAGDNSAVTQFHLNQAIKNAINNDAVLNKLLLASDGPSNTLTVKSLTDGVYNANDLLLTVSSAYDSTSVIDQAAILAAYKLFTKDTAETLANAVTASGTTAVTAFNAVTGMATAGGVLGLNASAAVTENVVYTVGAFTAAGSFTVNGLTVTAGGAVSATEVEQALETGLSTALLTVTGAYTPAWTVSANTVGTVKFTSAIAGTDVANLSVSGVDAAVLNTGSTYTAGAAAGASTTAANGTASTANSDNTINMGPGQDVLVLGTGSTSNETIVFSGTGIKTAIINFESGAGGGADKLSFNAYLTGTTGTTLISRISTTLGANATAEANEVNILAAATFTATDTFAGLTGAKLLTALNTTGNVAYAGIVDGSLNAANTYTTSTLVGGVGSTLVMVENTGNLGEYALFELTFNGLATNVTGDFTAATLIGTVDFGGTSGLAVGNLT